MKHVLAAAKIGNIPNIAYANLLVLLSWQLFYTIALVSADPLVHDHNKQVTYQGTTDNGVDQFQGIPFAEDTSGHNRFAAPKPFYPPAGSTIHATNAGPACPQPSEAIVPFMSHITYQSEDCLNLRIARPADATHYREPLPVMVYIYGGGSFVGQAYDKTFNPIGLIQQSIANDQPVIYVAMNYRVGVFGFAAAEFLKTQKAENNGLRDQHLALKWVRDNIDAFGGDPNRVTLYGQSFGSISVGLQLIAWGGEQEKLFHRAILCSGSIAGDRGDTAVKANTVDVASRLGCPLEDGIIDEKALACLKNVPLEDLLKINIAVAREARPPFGFRAFTPVIDEDMIPDTPSKLLEQGRFLQNIPTIATWTRDDGTVFIDPHTHSEAHITHYLLRTHNSSHLNTTALLSLYPLSDFIPQSIASPTHTSPQYFRAARIARDMAFTCPQFTLAQQISRYSEGKTAVYLAELNETRLLPFWEQMKVPWGVSHLSDIPYFFNEGLVAPGDNGEEAMELARRYARSFVAFAWSGDPVGMAGETFGEWPMAKGRVEEGDVDVLVIGGRWGTGPARIGRGGREEVGWRRWWERLGNVSGWRQIWEGIEKVGLKKRSGSEELKRERALALRSEQLAKRCGYLESLR
ncbi:uncharacterized protein KY384_001232 [Bacidia gigantensis]|uniref:uncharacterized protein n=1 Tax=Bacidia gigantensis TaxID=2732470 RepID=UPI001D045822|nr:uncharacterized protein KY384_001232 [Bacidia gigantensis]KAG8534387.1 hypothetical protein KY384_001232 [Bacidia gigantensis]